MAINAENISSQEKQESISTSVVTETNEAQTSLESLTRRKRASYKITILCLAFTLIILAAAQLHVMYIDHRVGYAGSEGRLAALPLTFLAFILALITIVSFIVVTIRKLIDITKH